MNDTEIDENEKRLKGLQLHVDRKQKEVRIIKLGAQVSFGFLGFSAGHDVAVVRSNPESGSALSTADSPSLSHSLSLK